jgi:hypothetical protein
MKPIVLTIPAPAAWIRSNQHKDAWRTRATLTKTWREAAGWNARKQRCPKFGAGPVRITVTFHRDDHRLYDLDGCALTAKACIDGLRDVGALDEDHVGVVPELHLHHGEQWADASVVLRIEPISQEEAS